MSTLGLGGGLSCRGRTPLFIIINTNNTLEDISWDIQTFNTNEIVHYSSYYDEFAIFGTYSAFLDMENACFIYLTPSIQNKKIILVILCML